MAQIIEPARNELEEAAARIAGSDATLLQKAAAVKDFAHILWSGSMVEAIYKAIVQSLTWWDMVLYGLLGLATISDAFLTEGAALVAVIAAELAQVGFVVSHGVKVQQACS